MLASVGARLCCVGVPAPIAACLVVQHRNLTQQRAMQSKPRLSYTEDLTAHVGNRDRITTSSVHLLSVMSNKKVCTNTNFHYVGNTSSSLVHTATIFWVCMEAVFWDTYSGVHRAWSCPHDRVDVTCSVSC